MTSKDRSVVAATGTVVLRGSPVSLDSDVGTEFAQHCARNVEGLLSESELRARYQLSDEDWAGLAKNEQLLRAVRTEVDRRIANGECAREAARRHHAEPRPSSTKSCEMRRSRRGTASKLPKNCAAGSRDPHP